jgi:hypothetical protein
VANVFLTCFSSRAAAFFKGSLRVVKELKNALQVCIFFLVVSAQDAQDDGESVVYRLGDEESTVCHPGKIISVHGGGSKLISLLPDTLPPKNPERSSEKSGSHVPKGVR